MSEYLFMNPDTGVFDGHPGKGLVNYRDIFIPKGVRIATFRNGEWITKDEKTRRERLGMGGYFMVKPGKATEMCYDMYASRRNGDLASAANSPCNMMHRDTKRPARAKAELV